MLCHYCFQEIGAVCFSFCPHCGKKIAYELLYTRGDSQTNDVLSNSEYRIITTDCEEFLTGEMWSDETNEYPLIENGIIYQQKPYSYAGSFLDLKGHEVDLESSHDKDVFESTFVWTSRKSKLIINEQKFKVELSSIDDKLLKISKDNKFGFINLDGQDVIPCIYDYADNFRHGFCVAQRHGRKVVLNEKNVIILAFDSQPYIHIEIISSDIISVNNIRDSVHSRPYGRIYSKDGSLLYEKELMGTIEFLGESFYRFDASGEGYSELFKYSEGQLSKFHNPNLIGYENGYFRDGLMHLRNHRTTPTSHAWMDKLGKIHSVSGGLWYLFDFRPSKDGHIMVRTLADRERNKWCLWNLFTDSKVHEYEGQFTQFFRCFFSEDLIPFKLYNGDTGYMRVDGTIALITETPCKNLGDFKNGIAYIQTDEGIAFINIDGKRITPYLYDRVSYCSQSKAFLAHLKPGNLNKFKGGCSHLIFKISDYAHINRVKLGRPMPDEYQLSIIPKISSSLHSRQPKTQLEEVAYLESVKKSIEFIYDSIHEVGVDYPYLYLERNNKKGLVSDAGNIVVPCVYDDIKPYFYKEDKKFAYAEVCVNNKWGFHDNQRECVPCIYDSLVREPEHWIYKGFVSSKCAIINFSNWKYSEPQYESVIFKDSKCFVTSKGKVGLFDKNTCVEIIKCMYDSIEQCDTYYLYKVYNNNTVGLYNSREKRLVIPCIYDRIEANRGLYKVFKNGKAGYYNERKEIISCKYDNVKELRKNADDGYVIYKNGKCAIIGEMFNSFPKYEYNDVELLLIDYSQGASYVFKVLKGTLWGIYEEHFWNPIEGILVRTSVVPDERQINFASLKYTKFIYSSIEVLKSSVGLYKCIIDGKCGIVNRAGEEKLPFHYDDIVFLSSLYYKVYKNNKVGIYIIYSDRIDSYVKCFISCEYDDVIPNYKKTGDHWIKNNGKWGILNGLKCDYEKIEPSQGSYVIAWSNGKCGLCQRNGNVLSEIIYDEICFMEGSSMLRPFYPFKVRCGQLWGMISPYSYIECKYDDIIYSKENRKVSFVKGISSIEMTYRDFMAKHLKLSEDIPKPRPVHVKKLLKFEL